jgi:signal transduction histidine kinase/ActR/RegA family two-component response regulator
MEALPADDEAARESERVLLLTPHGRDGEVAAKVLTGAGLETVLCSSMEEVCEEIGLGAGAVLIAVEALGRQAMRTLVECLDEQASWSELPLILFAAPQSDRATPPIDPIDQRAHITILDRPLRTKTLISATRSALRSRRRQYQLRDVMEALENRVQERDKFLAILGHELRNPLGAILLASQMVDDGADGLDLEHVALIERQARHLTHLVDDLLELSRITAGKIVLQRTAVNLGDAVEQSLTTMQESIQNQHHTVTTNLEAVPVDADPVRLEQIISNLLSNAVKYTPPGGRIAIAVGRRDNNAELRVTDNGVGIAPERLNSIFGLFTQAENAIGRAQGGMGIGLSLVKNLVELHGGRVHAESGGVGQGSSFIVELPLANQVHRRRSVSQPAPAAVPISRPRRIVVVEDNADVRTLLQLRLRRFGHQVEVAEDGETGLQRITSNHPEVAILDIGLPGIDGYELASRVREALGDDIYLVALSGFGQPEDKRRARDAGFDEHLTKPVDVKALEELLQRVPDAGEEEP